jgi:hypothetical protein
MYTVNSVATKLGVDRDVAYNLVKFLEATGLFVKTGDVERVPGVRGKGSSVFKLSDDFIEKSSGIFEKLKNEAPAQQQVPQVDPAA